MHLRRVTNLELTKR